MSFDQVKTNPGDTGFEVRCAPEIEVTSSTPMGAFALAILRDEFLRFLQHEPGARIGDDPEALHQMRVACRRLRAALHLFEPYLPKVLVRYDGALRWVGRVLGSVRDWDVKLDHLHRWRAELGEEQHHDFEQVLQWVGRSRDHARQGMIRALESARYARLLRRVEHLLGQPPAKKPGYNLRAVDLLPDLVHPLYKRVLRAGRRVQTVPVPERYHRLRIRCKRLRYALEFASRLCGRRLKAHRKRLVDLQDLLGEFNDTAVAREDIHSWVEGRRKLPSRTLYLLGVLDERLKVQGKDCLADFPRRFRVFSKRSWRSMEKAFRAG